MSPMALTVCPAFGILHAPTVAAYRDQHKASGPLSSSLLGDEKTHKANGFVLSALDAKRPCCITAALNGLKQLKLPLLPTVFQALEQSPMALDPHTTQLALLARDGWPPEPLVDPSLFH